MVFWKSERIIYFFFQTSDTWETACKYQSLDLGDIKRDLGTEGDSTYMYLPVPFENSHVIQTTDSSLSEP